MITFKCQCGQMLKVTDEYAGKQGKCPKCGTVNIIPQSRPAADILTAVPEKAATRVDGPFRHQNYLVRKKIFKIFGAAFHIYDPDGNVAFYSKQKAFKLKEDIRLYTGEDMQKEVLSIQARNIIDFSAAYDVYDSTAGIKVGALKRKGLKSLIQDEWIIMDTNNQEIGLIKEDSTVLALVRRFLCNLIPQKYHGQVAGRQVCIFKQNFNPFVMKIHLDYSMDTQGLLDRRLGIAAAVLLCAIEGRQD
jgi:phage FluMu protein Com